jgi:uncharacterized protein DUF6178
MTEDRTPLDVLARITENSELARAVPLLRPEVLHAVILQCGLQDSGDLLALTTAEQLSALFDLDLWKPDHAGADEQFDAARFCEWLEVLVESGPALAADRLAKMDAALVVAGLSPRVKVFDPGVFEPVAEPSSADAVLNPGRERGVHAEIGGYVIVARRQDAWDPILEVLNALAELYAEAFHRVMRGCRKLSHSGREFDGLDELLSDAKQTRFDLSLSREQRRERIGFLSAPEARAFLESARHSRLSSDPPQDDPVFAAHERSLDATAEPREDLTRRQADSGAADTPAALASVIDVLREGGLLPDSPRALLSSGRAEPSSIHAALNGYLQHCAADDALWMMRHRELAFLANALMAGCSIQGRQFTHREAGDAVAATCNLGLEYWPAQWPASTTATLVAIFQVGWIVLHREVSIAAARELIDALDVVQCSDRDVQLELYRLRRELRQHLQTGTPWHARDRLDVLATLDLPAWAALAALLDECPVMLSNVSRTGANRPYTVNPAEFQCIASARDLKAIREFLESLPALLTG